MTANVLRLCVCLPLHKASIVRETLKGFKNHSESVLCDIGISILILGSITSLIIFFSLTTGLLKTDYTLIYFLISIVVFILSLAIQTFFKVISDTSQNIREDKLKDK